GKTASELGSSSMLSAFVAASIAWCAARLNQTKGWLTCSCSALRKGTSFPSNPNPPTTCEVPSRRQCSERAHETCAGSECHRLAQTLRRRSRHRSCDSWRASVRYTGSARRTEAQTVRALVRRSRQQLAVPSLGSGNRSAMGRAARPVAIFGPRYAGEGQSRRGHSAGTRTHGRDSQPYRL